MVNRRPPRARSSAEQEVQDSLFEVLEPVRALDSTSRAQAPAPLVEVRRSARRRRTVTAYRDGDRTVVLLPARMSKVEERRWVAVMLDRLATRDRRRRPSDDHLYERAQALSSRYLHGRAAPDSVRWVGNMTGRWGSCTVEDRAIRVSDRVRGMPEYVLDYVLLHELSHLIVPGHGADFWALLEAYPRTERARGFLDGWAGASGHRQEPVPDAAASDG